MLKDEALLLLFLVQSFFLALLGHCWGDVLGLVLSSLADILRTELRLRVRGLTLEDLGDVEREEDGGAQHDCDKDNRVHFCNI